jgi:ATP-dependent DNA helicase RecG
LGFDFVFPPKKEIKLFNEDELHDFMPEKIAVDIGENHKIERKSASYNAISLGDYFSMWANTPPNGGIILIGVENSGMITGCSDVDAGHISDLMRAGDIYAPQARYRTKEIAVKNHKGHDDLIIAIRVLYREDRVVETNSGKVFIRRGSSKRELDEAERRELEIMKGQLEIESEPVHLVYPDDFNLKIISQFVDSVRYSRNMSPDLTPEEVLELRRLGKIKNNIFKPNLACALLFAKDPQLIVPGCKIRFLRFEGITEKTGKEYNVVKSFWLEGCVPDLIAQTEKVLEAQLREFMRLGEDGKFISTAEYPKDAWYETIVNACVHRSYNLKNMHVVVKMFDDRLEVESPGSFPPPVTPENIYDTHQPRNPHLMDAMFYLKYVQCAHEGTRRIRDSMAKLGLPAPIFQERMSTSALVRVTLRNDVEHRVQFVDSDAFRVLGEALSSTLDAFEKRIVNFIAENGTINVTEAARIGGKRWHRAKATELCAEVGDGVKG